MSINLIAIYNFNHHKLAYTETAHDDNDYQMKYRELLNKSNHRDLSLYGFRRLDTPQPGPHGLREYDSYYQDMQWYKNFDEFQARARALNQITDTELKQYWQSKYNYHGKPLTNLFNDMLTKLNFEVKMTYQPIEKIEDTVDLINLKSIIVSKLSGMDDGYHQWEIINDIHPLRHRHISRAKQVRAKRGHGINQPTIANRYNRI